MEPVAFLKQHRDELVLYDRMTTAIAECERVDEAKAIRDRARAIEVYSAQALNYEAESKAAKIRLRAERRCGQLLKEMKESNQRNSGHGDQKSRSRHATPKLELADLGITKQQSSDWQKLAAIPEKKFEERLNAQSGTLKPSTAELIREPSSKRQGVDEEVLFIWGRICDFERHECMERDPHEVFDLMPDYIRDDVMRIVPKLVRWLKELRP